MRHRSLMSFVIVSIALGLTGCQQTGQPNEKGPAMSLTDYRWNLVELDGRPIIPVEAPRAPYLEFSKEGRIAGSASVNRIMGAYTLEGERLTIKPGGMTMMAGPEELMQQEQAFTAALATVTAYRTSENTLELLAGDKVIARFKATPL